MKVKEYFKNILKKTQKKAVKKHNSKHKETFTVKEVVWLLVITCIINAAFIVLIKINPTKTKTNITSNDDTIEEIIETYNYIKNNYYKDVDDKILVNGAVKGMTEALGDKYSEFIEESESDTYNIILEGEYYGIGVQIADLENKQIMITNIIANSPASKTDLKAGDIITKLNGESTENMTSSDIGKQIKGAKNVEFAITIKRNDQEKTIKVRTEKVILDSVTSEIISKDSKKVGYIYISIFAANTDTQFINKLAELEQSGIDSLIIDVRDNTGGHLSAITNILSSIMNSNKVIYQISNRDGKVEKIYSSGTKSKTYPIVVLGNGASASASELLISGLRESYGAKFVGTKTFGKGSVQELQTISSTGEQYKITTKKWLTANGNSIDGVGITPDYAVELSEEYMNNPSNDTDNQLQKALEIISK